MGLRSSDAQIQKQRPVLVANYPQKSQKWWITNFLFHDNIHDLGFGFWFPYIETTRFSHRGHKNDLCFLRNIRLTTPGSGKDRRELNRVTRADCYWLQVICGMDRSIIVDTFAQETDNHNAGQLYQYKIWFKKVQTKVQNRPQNQSQRDNELLNCWDHFGSSTREPIPQNVSSRRTHNCIWTLFKAKRGAA